MSLADHWGDRYGGGAEGVGWYEAVPATLADVLAAVPDPASSIIDVGAGASTLVDELVDRGYADITLLDVTAVGLDLTRRRLGEAADRVSMVVADITTYEAPRRWDLWHDRAVFHFLVEPAQRRAYLSALDQALSPDGRAVIATFGPEGPTQCAALPVCRYDAEQLASAVAPVLVPVSCRSHEPRATDTDRRPYTICTFARHQ